MNLKLVYSVISSTNQWHHDVIGLSCEELWNCLLWIHEQTTANIVLMWIYEQYWYQVLTQTDTPPTVRHKRTHKPSHPGLVFLEAQQILHSSAVLCHSASDLVLSVLLLHYLWQNDKHSVRYWHHPNLVCLNFWCSDINDVCLWVRCYKTYSTCLSIVVLWVWSSIQDFKWPYTPRWTAWPTWC